MNDLYVIDPRPDDDSSLGLVPHLRTYDDILTYFGPLTIDPSQGWDATPVGEACWKVVGFHVTIPQVVIAPKVLDVNGDYISDKLVYWYYTGAPANLIGDHHPKYFGDQGLFARTKAEGNGAEFVITKHHWMGPGDPGPDSVWVAAEPGGPQFSDAVHGLGMRGGTNHLIVSPIFQHVVKGVEQPIAEAPEEIVPDLPPAPDLEADPLPITGEAMSYELVVVIGGQEVGRIPIKSVAPGDSYVAISPGAGLAMIGYMPLAPGKVTSDGLALHPGGQGDVPVDV